MYILDALEQYTFQQFENMVDNIFISTKNRNNMSFGYPQLYANGLNNNTQLRRSTDMVYQRGGNYNIVLTGSTYESDMEMDVDLYGDGTKVEEWI